MSQVEHRDVLLNSPPPQEATHDGTQEVRETREAEPAITSDKSRLQDVVNCSLLDLLMIRKI